MSLVQSKPVHPISSIFIDQDLCTNFGNGNNTFVFNFGRDICTTETTRISVSNFSVPHSWFNITTLNNNTQFYYVWFDGGSGLVGSVPTAAAGRGWNVVDFNSSTTGTQLSATAALGGVLKVAAGSNGAALPQSTIYLNSVNGLPTSGSFTIHLASNNSDQTITYNSLDTVNIALLGCSGGTGTLTTNDAVKSLASNAAWASANGGTIIPVNVPAGFYSVSILNSYLQFVMQQNGHYLVNTAGQYVYYMEFVQNQTSYRLELHSWQLPTSLPAGWSNPGGLYNNSGISFVADAGHTQPYCVPKLILWDPTSKFDMTKSIAATSLFTYFGFYITPNVLFNDIGNVRIIPAIGNDKCPNNGSYSLVIVIQGDTAPVQTPVHTVTLTCTNYVDNPLRSTAERSVSTFVITSQNITTEFGNDIINSNFFTTWIPLLANHQIKSLEFRLMDQEGTPLILQDPDINIELLITDLRYN
jgi:hypothetical protein